MKYVFLILLGVLPSSFLMSQRLKKCINSITQYIDNTSVSQKNNELLEKCKSDFQKQSKRIHIFNGKIYSLYATVASTVLSKDSLENVEYDSFQKTYNKQKNRLNNKQLRKYSHFIKISDKYVGNVKKYNKDILKKKPPQIIESYDPKSGVNPKIKNSKDSIKIRDSLQVLEKEIERQKKKLDFIISKINTARHNGNCTSCESWKDTIIYFLKKTKAGFLDDELYDQLTNKENCYNVSFIKLDESISIKDVPFYFNRRAIRDNEERVIKVEIPQFTTYEEILSLYSIGIDDLSHLRIIFNRLKFYNLEILYPQYNVNNLREAGGKLKKINRNDVIRSKYIYLPNLSALSLKYSNTQGDKDVKILNFNQLQSIQK